MTLLAFKSLENLLKVCFIGTALTCLLAWSLIAILLDVDGFTHGLITFVLSVLQWRLFGFVYRSVLVAFKRAGMHLEALNNQDYLQHAKPTFETGKVGEFHHGLENLSIELQQIKSRYDQNIFLVYRLIEQLDSPIMVFNQFNQLTYANDAFNKLFPQPWQMYRHSSPDLLGIACVDQTWRFTNEQKNAHWQIRHSEFIEQGNTHQLIVFINISAALRQNQLTAWQQLIRVLGHEIRNSLTPVSALAQGLTNKLATPRDKQALSVINERCIHLIDFVARYASVTKPFQLNKQMIDSETLATRLQRLLMDVNLDSTCHSENLWADPALLEQVLINLIKNADEASEAKHHVQLIFSENEQHSVIEVIDQGHGFANLDNLFVPLYTTKQNGQGLGLSFCRNIIEQHQGNMTLVNNTNQAGVTVSIRLPVQPAPVT